MGEQNFYIVVKDTGIGIPPEYHSYIFEEFSYLTKKDKLHSSLNITTYLNFILIIL